MGTCFLGKFTYSVDTQRRVAVPREWREGQSAFYLLPGRNRSIQMLPEEVFEKEVLEKLRKVSFANAKRSLALAQIGSRAARCTWDKQGRITLTPDLMQHAGITDQVVLVGGVTTIQMWTEAAWTASDMTTDEMLDEVERVYDAGEA